VPELDIFRYVTFIAINQPRIVSVWCVGAFCVRGGRGIVEFVVSFTAMKDEWT